MKLFIVVALLTLTACGEAKPTYYDLHKVDQCMRREIFKECLMALPKGPQTVATSNDWDEVVDSCGTQASRQSERHINNIKQECRP